MIGKNLHANAAVRQDLAQSVRRLKTRLDMRTACGRVRHVMVAQPLRARTGSLDRYPFLDGRRAFPPCTPPIFSCLAATHPDHQRSFAQTELICGLPSIGTIRMRVSLSKQSYSEEGSKLCRLPNGWRAPHALSHSPLAVTRRWSRVSWVRVRVPVQRSFLTAIRSPVLSSVVPPTCFTASRTPVAANPVAGTRLRLTILPELSHRTLQSGGFLLSDAGLTASPSAGCRPCCQEKEGT